MYVYVVFQWLKNENAHFAEQFDEIIATKAKCTAIVLFTMLQYIGHWTAIDAKCVQSNRIDGAGSGSICAKSDG